MSKTTEATVCGVDVDAVILDLDGVITRTAKVHAAAWKRMFDAYLQHRAEREGREFEPFSIDKDYRAYVDGKPRYDGVRSFLAARGIQLPEGSPDDAPDQETVRGLGNRKNAHFHELLEEGGVEVFDDAVAMLFAWREQGLKTAVVSSSKNCEAIVRAAGLDAMFDRRVDGRDAQRLQLPGKPAPDIFLRAAEELDVAPSRAVVLEDAVAGVEAGHAGGFALVVGVARAEVAQSLLEHGADVVVRSLEELVGAVRIPRDLPLASESLDELAQRLHGRRAAVFLDYDGTLTPIVSRPEDARLAPPVRELVARLAEVCPVAIVSGRDRADAQQLVGLEGLYYAGSHGFDITGPGGLHHQHEGGTAALPDLDEAQRQLEQRLGHISGAQVERKRFALAVHYRNAPEDALGEIERAVDEVWRLHSRLRKRGGKKIFELQPDIDWHKGKAVLWLLQLLGLDGPEVVPFYLGDDVTDEDAFRALAGRGIGVLVGETGAPSAATYRLSGTDEVPTFLQQLASLLAGQPS